MPNDENNKETKKEESFGNKVMFTTLYLEFAEGDHRAKLLK